MVFRFFTARLAALLTAVLPVAPVAAQGASTQPASVPAVPAQAAGAQATGAQATDDPAVFAPKNALAFVGISDLGRGLGDFQKSGMGMIYGDRAAAAAFPDVQAVQEYFDELRAKIAKAVGVEPAQMQWPFDGSAAAFVYRMPGAGGRDGLVLGYGVTLGVRDAATAGKYHAKLMANLKVIAATSDEAAAGVDRIEYFRFDRPPPASQPEADSFVEPAAADPDQILENALDWHSVAVCLRKDRLFVGDSIATVREMLDRAPADSLAANKNYGAIDRLFEKPGGFRFYFDVPRALGILREIAAAGTKEFETILGAGGMGPLIGVFDSSAEKYDNRVEFLLLMEGARSGVAKILSNDGAKTAEIGEAPADALYAAQIHLDTAAAFDELRRVIREASPADDDMQWVVKTKTGATLDLRADLIGVLRGSLRFVVSAPASNDPAGARAWLSIGCTDVAKAAAWLACLGERVPMTDHSVADTTVHDLPFGASVAILKDRIVVGTSEAVDEWIELKPTKTLADERDFRRALELVPEESIAVSYLDATRLVRTTAAIGVEPGAMLTLFLQKPAIALVYYFAGANVVGAVGPGFKDKIEPWARLCRPSISTLTSTPEGLRSTMYILKPAAKSE